MSVFSGTGSGSASDVNVVTAPSTLTTPLNNLDNEIGAVNSSPAASDSANDSNIIGFLKRLVGKLPSAVSGDKLKVDGAGGTFPVSGTVTATLADQQYDSGTPVFVPAYFDSPGGSVIPVSQDANAGMPISGTVTANLVDAENGNQIPLDFSSLENDGIPNRGVQIGWADIEAGAFHQVSKVNPLPISLSENAIIEGGTERILGTNGGFTLSGGVGLAFNNGDVASVVGTNNPLPISATSLPLPEGTVNQSPWFPYSGAGTHAAFDCGADADYVYIYLYGGGGGYTHNLQLSANSAFTSFSDTTSQGGLNLYQERMPTSNLDTTALNFSNARFRSGLNGLYVLSLHHVANIKNRWIRVSITGAGGGSWSIRYVSVRAPYKGQPSVFDNFPGHRTLTHSIVDINSTLRELPVTVSGTAQTSDRGATGMATVSTFSSVNSVELRPLNVNRKLLTIFNEGAGTLHVLYGDGTASTSNYSVRLTSGDYLEIEKYTGRVMAIFATAGNAKVTEITT